jgi:FSR family fosmidomycin resistance protein-like MFS transporter
MATEPQSIAVALPPGVARDKVRPGLALLLYYSLGHFAVDLYSAALGVYQPLFAKHMGVTLTQAGLLGGLMVFAGSVMQPVYGLLSDRYHSRMFSVLAPLVAGVFISCLGLAPNFGVLALMVFIGASAVASFHPQSSVRAASGIREGRATAMAFFISSGQLGFALGPTFFSILLTRTGLEHSYWAVIPGVLITIVMLWAIPEISEEARAKAKFNWRVLEPIWKPLLLLYALVFLRSVLQISFTQFLPLYLTKERAFSYQSASLTLTLYSAMGAVGGFVGGSIADRFGGRKVILYSLIGSVPFLILFFVATGPLAVAALGLAGLILLSTNPVNIVMAQNLAPGQSGTISALMMGFAWGMAGMIFIPLAGLLADHFTLHVVLSSLIIFPVAGWLLAFRLPK